jgi:predicted ArsR family transcriptional regulator
VTSPSGWTFFTNHGHTLLCIARDPGIRMRDLAVRVGVTERAAQRIVADLVEAGYLERTRDGRRNRYQVREDLPFRHPVEQPHRVGEVLAVLADADNAPQPPEEAAC